MHAISPCVKVSLPAAACASCRPQIQNSLESLGYDFLAVRRSSSLQSDSLAGSIRHVYGPLVWVACLAPSVWVACLARSVHSLLAWSTQFAGRGRPAQFAPLAWPALSTRLARPDRFALLARPTQFARCARSARWFLCLPCSAHSFAQLARSARDPLFGLLQPFFLFRLRCCSSWQEAQGAPSLATPGFTCSARAHMARDATRPFPPHEI